MVCICSVYHVSVNHLLLHTMQEFFINLQLYVGRVIKLKLHLHGPMYFVGTM
jgi:hypothetical protein